MRRRQFLAATAGTLSLPSVARGSPRPTSLSPAGTAPLRGLKEVVVDPDGTTVYAAATGGFAVFDVSGPTPERVAERRDVLADADDGPLRGIQDVKIDGDRLAVVGPANRLENAPQAAVFFDVSDPAAPEQVGVYETNSPIHNCDIAGGHAYLTANRGGRAAIDIVTADTDPTQVGTWSLADRDERWADVPLGLWVCHDVSVHAGTAYVAHWDAGTVLLDVTDPTDPGMTTRFRGRPLEELLELGDRAAALASIEPPGNDHYVTVNDDATLLGVGVESWDTRLDDAFGGPGGVTLYDISTPTEPRRLAHLAPPPSPDPRRSGVWTTAHNFDFDDDRLYTSWYRGGVRVYDISNPSEPGELARYRRQDTTSFWTAQSAADGFVASSRENPTDDTAPGALFYFPDPPADTTPVAATAHSTTATRSQASSTDDPAEGRGSVTTTGGQDASDGSVGTETTATGPGFGVVGALAGLGVGGAVRWVRRDTDE